MSHGLPSGLLTQTTYSFRVHWGMSRVPSLDFRSWILRGTGTNECFQKDLGKITKYLFFFFNGMLDEFACHPCARAMLIFSVSFQLSIRAVKASMITKYFYSFIYPIVSGLSCSTQDCWSPFVGCGIFSCSMWTLSLWHVRSSSLTGDQTQAPCIENAES